jgi:hypothetical protein
MHQYTFHTHNTHVHKANNPMKMCSGCVLWINKTHVKPIHRFSLGVGQSLGTYSVSCPHELKMFWKTLKTHAFKWQIQKPVLNYCTAQSVSCLFSPFNCNCRQWTRLSREQGEHAFCFHLSLCVYPHARGRYTPGLQCTRDLQAKCMLQRSPHYVA